MLDGCQMLSLDALYKYSEATSEAFNALIGLCVSKADTRARLYRWWLFNLITGNSDAHLKNLSFFASSDGWVLAPHDDLLCTTIYAAGNAWGADVPVTPPGGVPYNRQNRGSAIAFGSTVGINARAAERELDFLLERVQAHVGRLYGEYEAGAAHGVDPGEARLLRGSSMARSKRCSRSCSRTCRVELNCPSWFHQHPPPNGVEQHRQGGYVAGRNFGLTNIYLKLGLGMMLLGAAIFALGLLLGPRMGQFHGWPASPRCCPRRCCGLRDRPHRQGNCRSALKPLTCDTTPTDAVSASRTKTARPLQR